MEYLKYILLLVAYLLGSIPTALILGKITKGIDIREHGSGNLGTTNAFRVLGKKPGIVCLIVDITKGAVVIALIKFMDIDIEGIHILFYGAAAIIGHVYPIFAGFKGGKAVATSMGMALAMTPMEVSIGVGVFILTLMIWKYVSVSSTLAAVVIFCLALYFEGDLYIKIFYGLVVLFIIYRHKTNYVKLLNGTENKIGSKNKK